MNSPRLEEITTGPRANDAVLAAARENQAEIRAWSPNDIDAFLAGQITLGELEGIPKSAQYRMAETGYVFLSEGKLDAARRVFEGLHALDPFDAYFLMALGSIAQQRGHLDAAEAHYSRSLEINPYSIAARAHRGEVRVLAGRLLEAAEDFERVAREDPAASDPAARRALAVAHAITKDLEQNQAEA